MHAARRLRGGHTLTIRGDLGGAPQRGVAIDIQARDGRSWRTFDSTTTRAGGRFALRYRFARAAGIRRYHIRARLRKQASYPYASSASRSVPVTVVG